MRDLLRDVIENALAKVYRRNGHTLKFGRFGVAGYVVENARNIAPNHGVSSEERQIGINARGNWMIVARANMNVSGQFTRFTANDQLQLCVRL